jgi:hypothetical protein
MAAPTSYDPLARLAAEVAAINELLIHQKVYTKADFEDHVGLHLPKAQRLMSPEAKPQRVYPKQLKEPIVEADGYAVIPKMSLIVERVADSLACTPEGILSTTRERQTVRARHVAMYLGFHMKGVSYLSLGKWFKVHHTSVIYAVEHVTSLRQRDPNLDTIISEIERGLR